MPTVLPLKHAIGLCVVVPENQPHSVLVHCQAEPDPRCPSSITTLRWFFSPGILALKGSYKIPGLICGDCTTTKTACDQFWILKTRMHPNRTFFRTGGTENSSTSSFWWSSRSWQSKQRIHNNKRFPSVQKPTKEFHCFDDVTEDVEDTSSIKGKPLTKPHVWQIRILAISKYAL